MIDEKTNTQQKEENKNASQSIKFGNILTNDRIELWRDIDRRKVYFNQTGKTFPFDKLTEDMLKPILILLNKEPVHTRSDLRNTYPNIMDRLEAYSFYLFPSSNKKLD